MPILLLLPEPVPFHEVAAILAEAVRRAPGGAPAMLDVNALLLASALEAAGLRVVRDAAPGPQLTL